MQKTPTNNDDKQAEKSGYTVYTPVEAQRKQVERLLKNPDRFVDVGDGKKGKRSREGKDTLRNIGGSCAGAGSGDFHVYRASRRREYARLEQIEGQQQQEKEEREFQERRSRMRDEDEARVAKRREQRQRKKQRRGVGGKQPEGAAVSSGLAPAAHDQDTEKPSATDTERPPLKIPVPQPHMLSKDRDDDSAADSQDGITPLPAHSVSAKAIAPSLLIVEDEDDSGF